MKLGEIKNSSSDDLVVLKQARGNGEIWMENIWGDTFTMMLIW